MPLYSREQYESDMATIAAIRSKARSKLVRVEMLRADVAQHAADGHPANVLPCAYCAFAQEAISKLAMNGLKYKELDDKLLMLEESFTQRLRALARYLSENDRAKFLAGNCRKAGHKCSNPKSCGCSCHGRKVLQWRQNA